MKRLSLLLPICLLLFSCTGSDTSPDPHAAARAVIAACEGEIDFSCADADFIATNLSDLQGAEKAAVYYGTSNNGTEIGFFLLSDASDIPSAMAAIRRYIGDERRQTSALAELYPGNELTERLARYDHAIVDRCCNLVYYIIADPHVLQQASDALRTLGTE